MDGGVTLLFAIADCYCCLLLLFAIADCYCCLQVCVGLDGPRVDGGVLAPPGPLAALRRV